MGNTAPLNEQSGQAYITIVARTMVLTKLLKFDIHNDSMSSRSTTSHSKNTRAMVVYDPAGSASSGSQHMGPAEAASVQAWNDIRSDIRLSRTNLDRIKEEADELGRELDRLGVPRRSSGSGKH